MKPMRGNRLAMNGCRRVIQIWRAVADLRPLLLDGLQVFFCASAFPRPCGGSARPTRDGHVIWCSGSAISRPGIQREVGFLAVIRTAIQSRRRAPSLPCPPPLVCVGAAPGLACLTFQDAMSFTNFTETRLAALAAARCECPSSTNAPPSPRTDRLNPPRRPRRYCPASAGDPPPGCRAGRHLSRDSAAPACACGPRSRGSCSRNGSCRASSSSGRCTSFCDRLAGLSAQSSGTSPFLMVLFSSRVL